VLWRPFITWNCGGLGHLKPKIRVSKFIQSHDGGLSVGSSPHQIDHEGVRRLLLKASLQLGAWHRFLERERTGKPGGLAAGSSTHQIDHEGVR
jgi:hypothetical protein